MTKKTKASSQPPVQDLDDREVQRLAYINICRNLAEPLQMFLDHPFTPKEYAGRISDLFTEIHAGTENLSAGGFAADLLTRIASGNEKLYEPDWAKPLAHFIAEALEDEATPAKFHNDLIDAVDELTGYGKPAGQTARLRLANAISRAIAQNPPPANGKRKKR